MTQLDRKRRSSGMTVRRSLLVLVAWLALATLAAPAAAEDRLLAIGTGGVAGMYFPVGGAVARVVTEYPGDLPLRLLVESTDGSIENLVRLRRGELELGIARSDLVFEALHGTGAFAADGAATELRTLFLLHPEPLAVIARAGAGITGVADLAGKRVNLGPADSPGHTLLEALLGAYGLSRDSLGKAEEVPLARQAAALCSDALDAIAFLAGQPSGTIRAAMEACPAVLVPVDPEAVRRLVAERPYLAGATIPGGFYPGVPEPVTTIGPVATLVTTTALPAEAAYAITRAVFQHLDALRTQHPALAEATPAAMLGDGLAEALHEGALRYYGEAGLR